MVKIAVSDTNIFIDLVETGLLDEFFSLPWEIHTTDMVMYELKDVTQKDRVLEFHNKGLLHVKQYDGSEMSALARFYTSQSTASNVSIQDCSVWFYAKENDYILLTGDGKLRGAAEKSGIEVHGVIYVIDNLVEKRLLSKEAGAEKLEKLLLLNPRLPIAEIDRRVKFWRSGKKEDSL